ncbi:MAG: hypothetical protein ACP5N6_15495 [Anaerolineae bacterium]|jgi:hypothetical protein
MDERLVQWTLLREWRYLRERLGFRIQRRYVERIPTEHGIPDFVLVDADFQSLYVVELEIGVDRSKLEFVEDQLQRYSRIRFPLPSTLILLYAEDVTPPTLAHSLAEICRGKGIEPRTYALSEVQRLYQNLITELTQVVGIPLGPTCAMDVCYLRWMNDLIRPFVDQQKNTLPVSLFYTRDTASHFRSRTTYNVRKRLCQDFELLTEQDGYLTLSEYGRRFAEAMIPDILTGIAQIPPLSIEQRRILLEVLTNGNITPCKANIYYFLRFVYLTEGMWIPHSTASEPNSSQDPAHSYWQLATALFGKRYAWRTLTDFLSFTCNQCEELGLVERIKLKGDSDRAILTPLGSRVLGLIEVDLHLKRERIHIPLQAV